MPHVLTWTAIPVALDGNNLPSVAVHCSPRLGPPPDGEPPELRSYLDYVDWPATVGSASLSFRLTFYDLETDTVLAGPMDADIVSQPKSDLWKWLFPPDTPVTPRVQTTAAPARDPRLDRTYESYSIKESAERIRSAYVSLATLSHQNLRSSGALRSRRASLQDAPVQRPTFEEVSTAFAPLNLFLPQTPNEHEALCLQRRRAAFQSWVEAGVGGLPAAGSRQDAARRLARYVEMLRPLPAGATTEAASLLKPDAFAALVEKVMDEMRIEQTNRATQPPCEGVRVPAGLRQFIQEQPAVTRDQIDHALFHRVIPEDAKLPCDAHRLDFHELVSTLSSHPVAYPHVGIVFDIRGRQPIPNPGTYSKGRIAVEAIWQRPLAQDATSRYPRTAYQLFDRSGVPRKLFVPCSRSEGSAAARAGRDSNEDRVHQGVLDVSNRERFHLELMDTHGDYFKASSADQNGTPLSPDRADPQRERGVAKLRSCGIALVRTNRKDKVAAIARINERLQQDLEQNAATFYAEDLTLGYRVDVNVVNVVANGGSAWKSLCRRNTQFEYWPTDSGVPPTWQPTQADRDRLEGIVHGGAAQPADGMDYQVLETMFRWENWSFAAPIPLKRPPTPRYATDQRPLRLRPKHQAQGLPPMHFGDRYYVRCRAAFIDGSGPTLEDCDDSSSKIGGDDGGPLPFTRVESVDTPVTLLAEPLDTTHPGEQLAHLVIREGRGSSQRCLVPPRVSPYVAQLHGALTKEQPGAFGRYLWHPDGTFGTVAEYLRRTVAEGDDPSWQNAIFAPARDTVKLKFPYYPDPAAQGARVTLLHRRTPVDAKSSEVFNFYQEPDSWPDARALSIRLADAGAHAQDDAALEWDHGQTTLQVRLKKGRTATIIISPAVGASAKNFTLEQRLARAMNALGLSNPPTHLHWLLISQTELQLVHAVEKPLVAPAFDSLEAVPALGMNAVRINGSVLVDPDSTGELEVFASWIDPVDDGQQCKAGKPSTAASSASALTQRVELAQVAVQGEEKVDLAFDHVIGDTKFHEIAYSVSGKSRFASYFKSDTKAGDVDRAGRFVRSDPSHNRKLYVCNRGVPDAFKVLYAIPAFRWANLAAPRHTTIHQRQARTVRFYLDCKWWSSGAGELAAVLLREGTGELPAAAAGLVTEWGGDPVFKGGAIQGGPRVADFEETKAFRRYCPPQERDEHQLSGLPLVENPAIKVTAVAFEPRFDCNRKLWYCDVVLNSQSAYYPFVRFALARLQPNSVDGAHLSKVVTSDIVQLAPDRWVKVTRDKDAVSVAVWGYTFSNLYGRSESSTMVVRVEDRISHADPNLCWIPTIDPRTHKELVHVVTPDTLAAGNSFLAAHQQHGAAPRMAIWETSFELGRTPFGVHRRILVQEVETLPADDRRSPTGVTDCQRVVFADAVEF